MTTHTDYDISLHIPVDNVTQAKIEKFLANLVKTGNGFTYEYWRSFAPPNFVDIQLGGNFTEEGYNNWTKHINDFGLKAYIKLKTITRHE